MIVFQIAIDMKLNVSIRIYNYWELIILEIVSSSKLLILC